jgi:hypothetical protein
MMAMIMACKMRPLEGRDGCRANAVAGPPRWLPSHRGQYTQYSFSDTRRDGGRGATAGATAGRQNDYYRNYRMLFIQLYYFSLS